ncbi:MAG: hypothetical protein WDO19_28070 [Bacteroidota bacterium]
MIILPIGGMMILYTYILLKDPNSAAALEPKMANIMDKYNGKMNKEMGICRFTFFAAP